MSDMIQLHSTLKQTVTEGEQFTESTQTLAKRELHTTQTQSIMEKLAILSDAAKYDVACTSSGIDRKGNGRDMGNCVAAGICHSFSADGRCISLLKILMSNECVYDCKIVLIAKAMMCRAQRLLLMKSVS